MSSSPTRTRSWKCWGASAKTWPRSPVRSAAATARPCSTSSPARVRSAAASWTSVRIRPRPISGVPIPICRTRPCHGPTRTRTDGHRQRGILKRAPRQGGSWGPRLASGRGRSEHGRDHTHLERSEENRTVDKADRKCHRRLAFQHGLLPERRDQTGSRVLARDPSKPGDQTIERAQRCAHLSFGHEALDIEHLEQLFDPDDGDLKIAVEATARGELESAGADRDHVVL